MNTSIDNDSNPNLPTIAQTLKPSRRRNGKIARLPRKLRDQVNEMLSDGLPHAEIIASLGAAGERLNKDHLINWEKGGYLEWLRDRLWLDELFSRLEFAQEVLEHPECPKIREAGLAIAIKQMYELISKFDPVTFMEKLADDPAGYSRVLNSLSKLAEIGLRYDREHTESVRAATRESSKSTKAAGLTDSMLRQYENEFKLLRRPPKEHQPNPAQSQESPREVSSSPDLQRSDRK